MPLQYLNDRQALQDLMLNYAAAIDERDYDRYQACFAVDVEIIGFGTRTYLGRDAWLNYVWSALQKYTATQHMLGPQLATITGDTATTRSAVQAVHFLAGDDAARFTLWATYHTDMQRIDSRWQITRHELVVCGTSSD